MWNTVRPSGPTTWLARKQAADPREESRRTQTWEGRNPGEDDRLDKPNTTTCDDPYPLRPHVHERSPLGFYDIVARIVPGSPRRFSACKEQRSGNKPNRHRDR